jgi:exonuclease VII small subunit
MADFSWAQWWANAATSIVSFFLGFKASRFQLDLTRQRSEKLAASALRADLTRIDRNLGKSANAFGATFHGMTFETPALHRWSESIVVQLALADARIVSGCMELERELANFAATVTYFRQVSEALEEAREVVKRVVAEKVDENAEYGELLKRAANKVTAEERVQQAGASLRDAIDLMKEHHAKAKATIADLLRFTSGIADAPETEFMQLPEEVPRLRD